MICDGSCYELTEKMSLVSSMFLRRHLLCLYFPLRLRRRGLIELTGEIDSVRCHFDATKIADEFLMLQFLAKCFHFLIQISDDSACTLLNFFFHCILFRFQISDQFPQNLVFEVVYLPCCQRFLHQFPICLDLSGQLVQGKFRRDLDMKRSTLSGRLVMYSMD